MTALCPSVISPLDMVYGICLRGLGVSSKVGTQGHMVYFDEELLLLRSEQIEDRWDMWDWNVGNNSFEPLKGPRIHFKRCHLVSAL